MTFHLASRSAMPIFFAALLDQELQNGSKHPAQQQNERRLQDARDRTRHDRHHVDERRGHDGQAENVEAHDDDEDHK